MVWAWVDTLFGVDESLCHAVQHTTPWQCWIGSTVVTALFFALIVVIGVMKLADIVTLDVIEHKVGRGEISGAKDSVRNIWSNIALVSTLFLGVSQGMMQTALDNPMGNHTNFPVYDTIYVVVCGLATAAFSQSTLSCVIHLIYTEALHDAGIVRYMIDTPSCIGRPFLMVFLGIILIQVGTIIWVMVNYGIAGMIPVTAGLVLCTATALATWKRSATFSPYGESDGEMKKGDRWAVWTLPDADPALSARRRSSSVASPVGEAILTGSHSSERQRLDEAAKWEKMAEDADAAQTAAAQAAAEAHKTTQELLRQLVAGKVGGNASPARTPNPTVPVLRPSPKAPGARVDSPRPPDARNVGSPARYQAGQSAEWRPRSAQHGPQYGATASNYT